MKSIRHFFLRLLINFSIVGVRLSVLKRLPLLIELNFSFLSLLYGFEYLILERKLNGLIVRCDLWESRESENISPRDFEDFLIIFEFYQFYHKFVEIEGVMITRYFYVSNSLFFFNYCRNFKVSLFYPIFIPSSPIIIVEETQVGSRFFKSGYTLLGRSLSIRLNWPQCTYSSREFPDFPKLEMSGGCETFAASGDLCRVSPRGYVSARDNCSLDPLASCLRGETRNRSSTFPLFSVFYGED